ncbi:hypothetical protein Tco_0801331 [Tanacetum coccineum]|uniref:Uncharacterized protein n=1 Tax=Tanacetum coccineum TaxID=301880 RepID=A0ABQ4ZVR9_9ASTR
MYVSTTAFFTGRMKRSRLRVDLWNINIEGGIIRQRKSTTNIPAKMKNTPKIAEDTREQWLGISADGVDVNTGNRHHNDIYHNHPFRKQKKAFNGQQEFLQAPIPITREQIYNEVEREESKRDRQESVSETSKGGYHNGPHPP